MRWSVIPLLCAAALVALPAVAGPLAPQVFSVEPDPRMCPGPECGGWWISRVNVSQMRCVDGTTAASCYVAEIDWAALRLAPADEAALIQEASAGRVLVKGTPYLYPRPVVGQPLGALRPERAWVEFP